MKKYLALFAIAVLGVTGFAFAKSASVQETDSVNAVEAKENKVKQMNKEMFISEVFDYQNSSEWKFKGDKPAIIDLYADWCAPCRMIAPILKDLAAEYDGQITIYKVNVDKEKELAALFNVSSIPLLVFIPQEGTPQLMPGAADKATYKKAIDEFLLKKKADEAK